MTDPESLLLRMIGQLTISGELTQPWREAFTSVPRHMFIPETIWCDGRDGLVPLRRSDDPQAWLDRAYGSDAVVTQIDDGCSVAAGQTGRYITSSASQPNVIALMLDALNVEPGMTVCEIGTGTGYNAALLAHRVGADKVTTIEIDPQIAEHARHALAAAGYSVAAITGDGAGGYPPRAPYDRVIATAAVQHVPYPWVAQTRPGGQILTPWGTPYHNGALVSLTVDHDGTAEGGIVGNVAFMFMRGERIYASIDDEECDERTARRTRTTVEPHYVVADYDASLAIGMKVPGCSNIIVPTDRDAETGTLWFVDPDTGSWANMHYQPGVDYYPIHQNGPRDLWDEIEAAYHWWRAVGSPTADRWRIAVNPNGQDIRLTEGVDIDAG